VGLDKKITISVIVPARDAEKVLPLCLRAIRGSSNPPHEIIVVDDHSNDLTGETARNNGAKVLRTDAQIGPGGARNLGAEAATGDVLLFLDSDVVARPETLSQISEYLLARPSIVAVFGTYDDDPAEPNFISQYKNLQHHYVHQAASPAAKTFWAGCGAVRRDVFLELGGFDAAKYPSPSIEDIDFGYRLRAKGYTIGLEKSLCVKHLKQWTFRSHIRTEIFHRAIPWSKLILETDDSIRDLNLTASHRVSAVLAWLLLVFLPLAGFHYAFGVVAALYLLGIVALNWGLYAFFLSHRGVGFLIRAIPMHLLHYLYSSGCFASCWVWHRVAYPRFRKT
jgi:glycosyltransferase involved in cell wall biosynthesis